MELQELIISQLIVVMNSQLARTVIEVDSLYLDTVVWRLKCLMVDFNVHSLVVFNGVGVRSE